MTVTILQGDCRDVLPTLPAESMHCIVTSPPYWGLRDYGCEGQIGLEASYPSYVDNIVAVFRELRRVLRADGSAWLNLGDSYVAAHAGNKTPCGFSQTRPSRRKHGLGDETVDLPSRSFGNLKPKNLCGIPWRVAFALQADGWWLRQDIIWHKPNPMPESVTDRCTKAHEYLFLLSKSERYNFDAAAIAEPLLRPAEGDRLTPAKFGGANKFAEAKKQSRLHSGNEYLGTENGTPNKRSVWTVATQPFSEAHFATFPPMLIEPCILASCPKNGMVLDPFGGAGTTGLVADRLGRNATLIELNPDYAEMARARIQGDAPLFAKVEAI